MLGAQTQPLPLSHEATAQTTLPHASTALL